MILELVAEILEVYRSIRDGHIVIISTVEVTVQTMCESSERDWITCTLIWPFSPVVSASSDHSEFPFDPNKFDAVCSSDLPFMFKLL